VRKFLLKGVRLYEEMRGRDFRKGSCADYRCKNAGEDGREEMKLLKALKRAQRRGEKLKSLGGLLSKKTAFHYGPSSIRGKKWVSLNRSEGPRELYRWGCFQKRGLLLEKGKNSTCLWEH